MIANAAFTIGLVLSWTGWIALIATVVLPVARRPGLLWAGTLVPGLLAAGGIVMFVLGFRAFLTGFPSSLTQWQGVLYNPAMLSAVWLQLLAFTLLAHARIVGASLSAGFGPLRLLPALLIGFVFGPAGLLLALLTGGRRLAGRLAAEPPFVA